MNARIKASDACLFSHQPSARRPDQALDSNSCASRQGVTNRCGRNVTASQNLVTMTPTTQSAPNPSLS